MEFILKELTGKELLSVYDTDLKTNLKKEEKECFLLPEACVRGLIAKKLLEGFALCEENKPVCFGMIIKDREEEFLLLAHFLVLPEYRGHNYPEIFFSLLQRLYKKERKKTAKRKGIFVEIPGEQAEKETGERKKKLRFFKKLGAYLTDILPEMDEEYNILFLPMEEKLPMEEVKRGLLGIYREILPSFKDKRKCIVRRTDENDGLR